MIVKTKDGMYQVLSESGKRMGAYKTEDEAKNRLRQIEYFKNKPKFSKDPINPQDKFKIGDRVITYTGLLGVIIPRDKECLMCKCIPSLHEVTGLFFVKFDNGSKQSCHGNDLKLYEGDK